MSDPKQGELALPVRLTDDILRERLASLVETFNAAGDSAERVELHLEIVRLRALLEYKDPDELYYELVAKMLQRGATTIAEIANETFRLGITVPTPGHQSQEDPGVHATCAEQALGMLGYEPCPMGEEQLDAAAIISRDGCLDDWPTGQTDGYKVWDSIKWQKVAEGQQPLSGKERRNERRAATQRLKGKYPTP